MTQKEVPRIGEDQAGRGHRYEEQDEEVWSEVLEDSRAVNRKNREADRQPGTSRVLRVLTGNAVSTQELIGNVSRETVIKNKKEMLGIKNAERKTKTWQTEHSQESVSLQVQEKLSKLRQKRNKQNPPKNSTNNDKRKKQENVQEFGAFSKDVPHGGWNMEEQSRQEGDLEE